MKDIEGLANTLKASRLTLLLVGLFGKRQTATGITGKRVILKRWRGKTYFMDWVA